MKITPVASPAQIPDNTTPDHVRTAKAVAAFNAGKSSFDKPNSAQSSQSQEHPVANPSQVSVEELSAIKAKTQQPQEIAENANTSTETAPEATKQDPELEKRLQQMARQERAFRAKVHQENQRLKERETALAAREAAITQPQQPDLSAYIPKDRIKADPLTALEEAQVSWDELTNQALNRQPTDPRVTATIQKLEAKIAELEGHNKKSEETYKEQQQAQYHAALRQIKTDVSALVSTDPEFETVKAMKATNDVVELIEKTYQKDGIVLSAEEAAREVENYLIEEAMKVTQIQKIQKRMAEAKAKTLKPEVKTQTTQQQQQPMKTLTNATSATRKISARERAIARAEGFKGDF